MIFRRRKKQSPFTVISNYTLRDESLKPESLGVLCYLLSHKDDWCISARGVANHFGISSGRVNTIAADLVRNGYVRKVRHTDESGKIIQWDWEVFDEPELEITTSGEMDTINTIDTERTLATRVSRNEKRLEQKPAYLDDATWISWWAYKSPKRYPSNQALARSLSGLKRLHEAGHTNFAAILGLAIDRKWQGVPDPEWAQIKSLLEDRAHVQTLAAVE